MIDLMLGGGLGLVLGIAVYRCGLTDRADVSSAIALRRHMLARRTLMMLGWTVLLTAFLSWLAVIDVDMLTVLPLHGGTIVGGIIFGISAALSGMLPGTAPAIAGGRRLWEGLSGMAGCLAGAMALPYVLPALEPVRALLPASANTLFQVTLDEPYLFAGGFLGQGCIGAVLMALALIIPPDPPPAETAAPLESPPAPEPVSTDASDVQEDTVIALLPGEEPVVVDTAAPEEAKAGEPEEEAPESDQPPDPEEPEDSPAGESEDEKNPGNASQKDHLG